MVEYRERSRDSDMDPVVGVGPYEFPAEELLAFIEDGERGDSTEIAAVPAVHLGNGTVYLEWPDEAVTADEIRDVVPKAEMMEPDELLLEETSLIRNGTETTVITETIVDVEPVNDTSFWQRSEFDGLAESPWRVAGVTSGEHGPVVTFERDE